MEILSVPSVVTIKRANQIGLRVWEKYQPINARGSDPDPVVCMKVRFEAKVTRGFSLSRLVVAASRLALDLFRKEKSRKTSGTRVSWCCVTKNIETVFVYFYCLLELFPSFEFSPIDVTLHFNGLGIFNYISWACWSKSMCGHRTVDVLHRWIIELTIWTPRSPTSSEEKSHT